MPRILSFILLLVCNCTFLSAQKVTHLVKVNYAAFTNKQITMLGYDVGIHKVCLSMSIGIGNGKDKQFLSSNNMSPIIEQKVRASQTIFPAIIPPNTYLESCNSNYKTKQIRLGFTGYVRRNDTLGRHPMTGPHLGVDALYSNTSEAQTVVYKSDSNETRFTFSGTHYFHEIGAATHLGWQFAFFKAHLYIDLRGVIVFYFPMMVEPNLNSPFAGNKWELQGSIGWHFYNSRKDEEKDAEKEKVRKQI